MDRPSFRVMDKLFTALFANRGYVMNPLDYTWSIKSEPAAGKPIIEEILRVLETHGWSEHDIFSIHIAVEEAVVNAIKHGNEYDPEKSVLVTCRLTSDYLRIEVTDEGGGFKLEDVPDPTDEERLEIPSGRGLMLMNEFMDQVHHNARGNSVTMEKLRTLVATSA